MLFKNIRTGKIIDVFGVTGDEWEPVNVSVPSPVSIDTKDDDEIVKNALQKRGYRMRDCRQYRSGRRKYEGHDLKRVAGYQRGHVHHGVCRQRNWRLL